MSFLQQARGRGLHTRAIPFELMPSHIIFTFGKTLACLSERLDDRHVPSRARTWNGSLVVATPSAGNAKLVILAAKPGSTLHRQATDATRGSEVRRTNLLCRFVHVEVVSDRQLLNTRGI